MLAFGKYRSSPEAVVAVPCLLSPIIGLAASVPAAGIIVGKAGDAVLFLASPDGWDSGVSADPCLWRTDGTADGTYRLPGCRTPEVQRLHAVGDRAVFWEYGPDNFTRLWGTDGTAAGTRVLGTFPQRLPYGELFFFARDEGGGRAGWRVDPVGGAP